MQCVNGKMILIATSWTENAKKWREVLGSAHHLYECDLHDLPSLEICLKKVKVDILLVDMNLLGENGVNEIFELHAMQQNMQIIAFYEKYDEKDEISAILYGAKAYLPKNYDAHKLEKVLDVIQDGELWVDRKFISRLLSEIEDIAKQRHQEAVHIEQGISGMTPREGEIARLVATGASNRSIAEKLAISERTVKAHLGVIFRKMGIKDRLQLALYMNRHQQISSIWGITEQQDDTERDN